MEINKLAAIINQMDYFKTFVDKFNKSDKAVPFSSTNIEHLERALEIKLPTDYTNFVSRFGDVWTPEVLDLIVDEDLDLNDVQQFWTIESIIYDKRHEWTSNLEHDLIPFASDSMGNIYGFLKGDLTSDIINPPVYLFDHDFDTVQIECNSFLEFIQRYNSIKK